MYLIFKSDIQISSNTQMSTISIVQVRKGSKEMTPQTGAHQESSLRRNWNTHCGVNSSFKLLILYSKQWIKVSICAISTTNHGFFGLFSSSQLWTLHIDPGMFNAFYTHCLLPFTTATGSAWPRSICKSSRPFSMKCTKMIWNKPQNIPKSYLPQLNYFKYSERTWSRANYWIFVYYFLYKKSSSYSLGRQLQPINSVFVF